MSEITAVHVVFVLGLGVIAAALIDMYRSRLP